LTSATRWLIHRGWFCARGQKIWVVESNGHRRLWQKSERPATGGTCNYDLACDCRCQMRSDALIIYLINYRYIDNYVIFLYARCGYDEHILRSLDSKPRILAGQQSNLSRTEAVARRRAFVRIGRSRIGRSGYRHSGYRHSGYRHSGHRHSGHRHSGHRHSGHRAFWLSAFWLSAFWLSAFWLSANLAIGIRAIGRSGHRALWSSGVLVIGRPGPGLEWLSLPAPLPG
jgi:hypothetical protein